MRNTVIKASAGTGKTFALATRVVRLLLLGVEPQHIVALTFSRMAAGEIFNRIAGRLATAASSDVAARKETGVLVGQLDSILIETIRSCHGDLSMGLPKSVFAELLRKLIHAQHVSMIGTLDSFMTRMVRFFPLELGLQRNMVMMDEYQKRQAQTDAVDTVMNLRGLTPERTTLMTGFRLLMEGRDDKCYFQLLSDFVEKWHALYLDHPEGSAWGDPETIWGPAGFPMRTNETLVTLAQRLRVEIATEFKEDPRGDSLRKVAEHIEAFAGRCSDFPTALKNIFEACRQTPTGPITFNCERKRTSCSVEQTRLLRQIHHAIITTAIDMYCSHTQGLYQLMRQIETAYAANTRRAGRLVFDDIPRLIARLDTSIRQNIEYRFDTHFHHWALDEFQDTSHAQWDAVKNLVDEVIQAQDERTLFIVGDMKQAIYGWREGDVRIFEAILNSPGFEHQSLTASYRYAPEIASFVNRLFDGATLAAFLAEEAPEAGEKWRSLWEPHTSAVDTHGFVSVCRITSGDADSESSEKDNYANALIDELSHVKPWAHAKTTAILVRSNEQGRFFADALRKAGLPVVWEGENAISDTPVVTAFLNMLRWVEHPDDRLALRHFQATPLGTYLAQRQDTGEAMAEDHVRGRIMEDISRHGLAAILQHYIEAIGVTDPFTQSRCDALVRAALRFAESADATASLSDFAEYVQRSTSRDVADPQTIKILTIHRSKGLGFDYVLLPIMESVSLSSVRADDMLKHPEGTWLMVAPADEVIQSDPTLAEAEHARKMQGVFESLCMYYVAMTRAKQALSVIVKAQPTRPSEKPFVYRLLSDVLGGLPYQCGDGDWYKRRSPASTQSVEQLPLQAGKRNMRQVIHRVTPSTLAKYGGSAANLFESRDTSTSERGTRLHEALQKIEWLSDTFVQPAGISAEDLDLTVPSDFRSALIRPEDVIDIWRERSFECLEADNWTSGTFDRVVFFERNGIRWIEVYDYKSNRMRDQESASDFVRRMCDAYRAQMQSYCRAIAKMAGVQASAVTPFLLLTATRSRVDFNM